MKRVTRHRSGRPSSGCRAGFTLAEMMISIVLLAVVVGGLMSVVVSVQRDYVRQRGINHGQENLRAGESAVTTVLRSSRADPFETGSALLDPDPLGHGAFDNVRVVSDYNPADGDFADPLEDVTFWIEADTLMARWQAGGADQPLAWPVSLLDFEYYDSEGNALASASQVVDASRVRVRLAADPGPRSTTLDRTDSWVYLRN